jgi:hypothetical protein
VSTGFANRPRGTGARRAAHVREHASAKIADVLKDIAGSDAERELSTTEERRLLSV